MATPAHQETRRFTRGLGKPGTAAELRQSVSEVVRTSVLVVSTRRTFPFSPLSPLCLADLLGLAFTHIFCWPGAPVRFTGELFRMRDPDTQTRKLFRQEINEDAFCPQKCNWSRWWQTRVHVNLKVWGINCINCCNPCIIIHKNVSPELTWSLPRLFCGLFFCIVSLLSCRWKCFCTWSDQLTLYLLTRKKFWLRFRVQWQWPNTEFDHPLFVLGPSVRRAPPLVSVSTELRGYETIRLCPFVSVPACLHLLVPAFPEEIAR